MATHVCILLMHYLELAIQEATDAAIREGGAGLVKSGRVMKGLTKEKTTIAIYPNDPQKPGGWTDEPGVWEHGGQKYAAEIGGGRPWKRRFLVEVRMFLQRLRLTQSDAYNVAYLLMDRVERAIEDSEIATECRTDREVLTSHRHALKQSEVIQSGGEKAPIMTVKLWLEFDTARER
jgi:hypothetical protein